MVKEKGSKNDKNVRMGGWGKRFYRLIVFFPHFGPAVRSLKNFKAKSKPKSPLSAVPNSRNSKTENFLFLFEKDRGHAKFKKNVEKIFLFLDANFFKVCGRKRAGR